MLQLQLTSHHGVTDGAAGDRATLPGNLNVKLGSLLAFVTNISFFSAIGKIAVFPS